MALLSKVELRRRLQATPPLVEVAFDLETQLQPNGIDLTLRDVARYISDGEIDFSNTHRRLAALEPIAFDAAGRMKLAPGSYLVTLNEIVHLPLDLAALGRTRSSLLRSGAALHTAVWDAGYSGRSQGLLTVYNPAGIVLHQNARILQLVFYELSEPASSGYAGRFQGENVPQGG